MLIRLSLTLFFHFELVPFQIPLALLIIWHRNQQTDINFLQCFKHRNLAIGKIRANAFTFLDTVSGSELLCRHTDYDAVEHIAFVRKVIWLGRVMKQLNIGCKKRELLTRGHERFDKALHLVETTVSSPEYTDLKTPAGIDPLK